MGGRGGWKSRLYERVGMLGWVVVGEMEILLECRTWYVEAGGGGEAESDKRNARRVARNGQIRLMCICR